MESYTSTAVPDWSYNSQETWPTNTWQPYDYPTYQEGGSSGSGQAQTTFWQNSEYDATWDDYSGTDTETSPDSGHEEIDQSDVRGMTEPEAAEFIFLQYRKYRRKWRRFQRKPVRRFRRMYRKVIRRRRTKGKGKGFGFGKRGKGFSFLSEEYDNSFDPYEETLAYLRGKGKGHRAGSSGKGFGRRKNPKGRDGQVMRCRICNSDEHFAARCPRAGQGGQPGAPPPTLFVGNAGTSGPLTALLNETTAPAPVPQGIQTSLATFTNERANEIANTRAFMTQEQAEDPWVRNDPWSQNPIRSARWPPVSLRPPQPVQPELAASSFQTDDSRYSLETNASTAQPKAGPA